MDHYHSIPENKFRIVIISDTHGYLNSHINNLITEDDYVIHAGDIMDQSIIQELKISSKKIFAVNGNNDNFESINDIEYIDTLIGKIIITHGDQHYPDYHTSLRNKFNDAFLIVYGHTHKHVIDMNKKPYVVNPGAAGKIRTQGGASCILLSLFNKKLSLELVKFTDDK